MEKLCLSEEKVVYTITTIVYAIATLYTTSGIGACM